MAGSYPEGVHAVLADKRQQFGSRLLSDPARVFHHNAWDNVEWSEEQAAAAERKVQENSTQRVCQEKQVDYEINAHKYWNDFYKIHENGFFKDRHWLFTEFPELAPSQNQNHLKDWFLENKRSEISECRNGEDGPGLIMEEQHKCSSKSLEHKTQVPPVEENVTQKISDLEICADEFPGSSATYRILEVGCGVGNTVFPILQTNNDAGLFVYCCDFSSTAIELVQVGRSLEVRSSRLTWVTWGNPVSTKVKRNYPKKKKKIETILELIDRHSLLPHRMQKAINRLSKLLKPGGMMLLRDYGRYDMAQLRFKKGQCLSGNFYVRGDGTRVYFFTQEELDVLFTTAGLEKVQNLVDRRLQVNRGKQLTMYRVWIQCKYRKPLLSSTS
uniref:tRNA N(3)-cytidine methyltransferase n=1 Tax=Aotus nancymaae TaxID=37293 RepID=A0A2K5CB67_AOTNA